MITEQGLAEWLFTDYTKDDADYMNEVDHMEFGKSARSLIRWLDSKGVVMKDENQSFLVTHDYQQVKENVIRVKRLPGVEGG
jgi:hypothetical protein